MSSKRELNPEQRIYILEEKDERRDQHIRDIRENVKLVAEAQTEILIVLGGGNLNKNNSVISMLDNAKKKLDELEDKTKHHEEELNQVRFWGKGLAGVIFGALLIVLKKIFE